MEKIELIDSTICIVGLGYVGLPLFCLLSSKYRCIGLDQDYSRVANLNQGHDNRNCVKDAEIKRSLANSIITSSWDVVEGSNIYIITVPTPVDKERKPDTSALRDVCVNLSSQLKKNDIIIFESTVYPGATEELCLPILETNSGLRLGEFAIGYSPERVNVGDNLHQLANTPKIISASDNNTLELIYNLYSSVIDTSIFKASSIKVAEAAKMYENVQRDVLIGLANEYSEFCRNIGIDIREVTSCASTKWNFSTVFPGLVGGHCIGVDTYYLLAKAKQIEQNLHVISTARKTNENKVGKVLYRIIKELKSRNLKPKDSNILILGFSYKKDTCDIRNTKIADLLKLASTSIRLLDCFDPLVDPCMVYNEYGINIISHFDQLDISKYDLIIEAVNHSCFKDLEFPDTRYVKINIFL